MRMRPFIVVSVALVCAIAFASTVSAQETLGVWKMNPAKSKYGGPAPKSSTITTTAVAGGGYKSTTDTVPAIGGAIHSEVTYMFDGRDAKVTGNPNADTQSYTKGADPKHWTVVAKKGGKVTVTTQVAVAADGKSRTSTQVGSDGQGNRVNNVIWYDKQ